MKRNLLWILTLMMASMCYAEDITIRYNGAKAEVKQNTKDSVNVIFNGGNVDVQTTEDAKQPTALLIGLNVVKNEPIYIYDGNGKHINTVTIPFSLRRSASLVSSPAFKIGNTYTVKTKGYERTFTLNEPFTAVR